MPSKIFYLTEVAYIERPVWTTSLFMFMSHMSTSISQQEAGLKRLHAGGKQWRKPRDKNLDVTDQFMALNNIR